MACSCSGNKRRSGGYGCRKAIAGSKWPACGCDGCETSCRTGAGCGCSGGHAQSGCVASCGCGAEASCGKTACCGCRDARSGAGCGITGECHPFWCGPCGPVEPTCGCSAHCPPGSVPAPYGFFTQTGALTIDAGAAIPFSGEARAYEVCLNDGQITLEKSGVYMVSLNMTVPANTTLATTLSVRLNGAAVTGGAMTIDKAATDSPLNAAKQLIIPVCEGSVLTVTSSEPIHMTAVGDSEAIAALTVVRVS